MNIIVELNQSIEPKKLAEALAESTPKEFAEFWFEFAEVCKHNKLKEFAKAMSPTFGCKRKEPLRELYRLMQYYELKTEYDKSNE